MSTKTSCGEPEWWNEMIKNKTEDRMKKQEQTSKVISANETPIFTQLHNEFEYELNKNSNLMNDLEIQVNSLLGVELTKGNECSEDKEQIPSLISSLSNDLAYLQHLNKKLSIIVQRLSTAI